MDALGPSRYSTRNRSLRGSSRKLIQNHPIPLEPLKEGASMDPHERVFLEAAERGDKHSVIRCLQGSNPVNVNCTNILGRSAIQIAVDNENVEIVELLLKQEGVQIGDALLYAIREGVYRIVEMLIDHPSITSEMLGCEWAKSKKIDEQSSEYSPDISPVILAATCTQFEILQLLLSRGARIEKPHQISCSCSECICQIDEDSLRHSLLRIHMFRALASPAWISLTSSDPILTGFKLSWELQYLARHENEFKDTYLELAKSCKKYACDLLDQCRSTEEYRTACSYKPPPQVIAVLNRSDNGDDADEDDEGELSLERLKLALKYEQKQFVAHAHCQQLLTSIWYSGLPGWRKRNVVFKIIIFLSIICSLPILVLIYLLMPTSPIAKLLRAPFMKFLFHSTSFAVFLLLLLIVSNESIMPSSARAFLRGPEPNHLEWLIFIWVCGFVWAEVKQVWEEGFKAYVRQWWNWMDFIMLSLYLSTFSLRLVAWLQMTRWNEDNAYGVREIDRKHWPHTDPTIVSEGLFAVANIFSFARIIYLFQANPHLGPLQISLGCMLIDIVKFLFIFFLVVTSFACGLNQLYFYFKPSVEQNVMIDENSETTVPFLTLENTLVTLFWSLFGLTNKKDIKLNLGTPFITETIGELLFIVYHAMAIIVLINMLIAMMSNSFLTIEEHADREWKFARSKLWMGYFDPGSTLPTPFNLIISPKSIYYLLNGMKRIICRCIKSNVVPQPAYNVNSITHHETKSNGQVSESDPKAKSKYEEVMRRLVSRYIFHIKKQLRQDGVNEDDLLEIKQDISSLRYELREDRKRESARTTGHMDNLKRDILRHLRTTHHPFHHSDNSIHNVQQNTLLSQHELETLKTEICATLKDEIREVMRETASSQPPPALPGSSPLHLSSITGVQSELYHTHLYTQL